MPFYDDSNPNSLLNVGHVSIRFGAKQCAGTPASTYPSGYTSTYDSDSGGLLTDLLKDTALGYYNTPTDDPVNKAFLDDLTTQFGEDYLKWKKLEFDYVFIGIVNIEPSGCIDSIEFDYSPGGCRTRIYTNPWNFTYHQLGHFDYPNDCDLTADPCHYYYGPPAECDGETFKISRYKLCLEDDRLKSVFVQTDTLN